MKYINQTDYEYIMNKHHDQSKPWDGIGRFIRRDEIFAPESGIAPEEIYDGIWRNDENFKAESHPVRKARALEYILMNTRIRCDSRDIFPAINMMDRPLEKTLIREWRREVLEESLTELNERRLGLMRDNIAFMTPDYDHSIPVWERLFELGFAGILEESERARTSRTLNGDQEAFFEGIRITYEAMLAFVKRLEALASATIGSEKMARALATLSKGAPKTFYEALLLSYIYFIVSEHIDCLQVRSLCNFDRQLYPFYTGDLENGVTEEELRTTLAYYFLQFTAIGNYWNQPVYLGGENADGSSVINELSYTFLDVYDGMGIHNPKIQIKVSDSTPKRFITKALDMVRRGHNCIVFISDVTIRHALEGLGVKPEEARLCNISGCYEYSAVGSYCAGMNSCNLMKPLEYSLHRGYDGVSGVFSGMESPDIESYDSFDKLFDEYKRHLLRVINLIIDTVNGYEGYLHIINPLSLLSATFPSCLEKARDAIGGGALYNTSSVGFGFIADVSDSLAMIKKYVYDKKLLTLAELVAMLDGDYKGNESWYLRLRSDRDKYGNNRALPDTIATDIVKFIRDNVVGRPNSTVRGGKWSCGFHVARASYTQATKTLASANGRHLGEELSKNLSASMGQNREGATAAILSVTKIDAASFAGDASLDLGLLPSAVKGEDGLEAMYGLVMTFCKRGGHAMHINVFDAATLRDAQAHPEKYQDLQIRVCGWNVLWNNINKEEQDGFIRQAEALI